MLGCSSWEPEKRAGAGQEVKGGVCVRAGRGLWGRGLGGGSGGAELGESVRGGGLHRMGEMALRAWGERFRSL